MNASDQELKTLFCKIFICVMNAGHYMAPERLLGKAFDKKVDVYSFGLILYQVCSIKFTIIQTLLQACKGLNERMALIFVQMIEGPSEFFSQTEEEMIKSVCHQDERPIFRMKDKYYPEGLKG